MRVLLVDDHPLFRQALGATLTRLREDLEIEQFSTVAAVRRALEADARVDLVLLDLKLPDNQGMTALLALKAQFSDMPIAIVSASDDAETVHTAQACGAAGFVPKAAGLEELSAAIEALVQGESWFPGIQIEDIASPLTPMQTRILDAVRRGLMNKQIAHELSLSEHTVKYHLTGIFRKLGCQTRSQLLAMTRVPASA